MLELPGSCLNTHREEWVEVVLYLARAPTTSVLRGCGEMCSSNALFYITDCSTTWKMYRFLMPIMNTIFGVCSMCS